eukprot:12141711-Karenia_brevis.AAC.1
MFQMQPLLMVIVSGLGYCISSPLLINGKRLLTGSKEHVHVYFLTVAMKGMAQTCFGDWCHARHADHEHG